MRPRRVSRSSLLAAALLAGAASCTGVFDSPDGGGGGDGGLRDGAAGGGGDGGGTLPFFADPPNVYVAKVKEVLVGLPPTDAELQAVTADPKQLGALVDGWMQLPEYQTKMLRFFQLAFEQTQITQADFGDMFDAGQLQLASSVLLQNIEESFARTMLDVVQKGQPFNQAMNTQTYAMTTALQLLYALLDVWQIDDNLNGLHDAFAKANSGVTMYVTSKGPIPIAQSIDPTSGNYMHWYDPKAAAACGVDPMTYPARANLLYDVLLGKLPMCKSAGAGQLTASDFTDWRMVTVRQPGNGEKTTPFYDLATLRAGNQSELVLNRPFVGFFTTPAFFANWQTNASNQMRVTMNQTFIVSTNAQLDGNDPTVPTSTPGLDTVHAGDPACVACHQLLDPSRSILAATFSWNYGTQLDTAYSNQLGLFAFEGVQANVSSVYDLGNVLATHPLVAPGWAQKLCYYVNSEPCDPGDPEFQAIAALFKSSGYSWNQLVKAVVTSPITTHTAATVTTTTNGEIVAVSRRDHLCAAWNARLGFKDVCGGDVTQKAVLPATGLQILAGLPSDGYGRGATAPVLPADPSLFYRAGLENLCESIAQLVIDNGAPPPGAKTWSSADPNAAIADFVSLVAGLPPSDPRAAPLTAVLQAHFASAKQASTATAALQSTFTVACMSPSAVSIGM